MAEIKTASGNRNNECFDHLEAAPSKNEERESSKYTPSINMKEEGNFITYK